jgi:hypothetical protein
VDSAKLQEIEKVLEQETLPDAFHFLVKVGEIPYKANRRALIELDLNHNRPKGMQKVQAAIDGIDGWIGELELFRDAASRIAKKSASVFRSA